MRNIVMVIGAAALLVAMVVIGPVLVIWSLNTLFPVLAIELTIWTWLAVVILGAFFSPNVTIRKKNG
jgi:heme A synthase